MSYQALKDCEDYESQPVKEQFSDGNLALEQTPTSKYLQYSRLLRSLLIVLSALLNVILAYALIARQGESHCGESEVGMDATCFLRLGILLTSHSWAYISDLYPLRDVDRI